jgi:hypothetical protein
VLSVINDIPRLLIKRRMLPGMKILRMPILS